MAVEYLRCGTGGFFSGGAGVLSAWVEGRLRARLPVGGVVVDGFVGGGR